MNMNTLKKIVLLLAAISLTKVLITTIGLFVSTIPLISELSSEEESLRIAYEIIAVYCSVVTVILFFIGISLYREATNRNPLRINFFFSLILFLILGFHVILATVGSPDTYIVQSSRSFVWLPTLASFVALVSVLIPRLQIFRAE
jgi:hypothetical protein